MNVNIKNELAYFKVGNEIESAKYSGIWQDPGMDLEREETIDNKEYFALEGIVVEVRLKGPAPGGKDKILYIPYASRKIAGDVGVPEKTAENWLDLHLRLMFT